MVPGVGKLIDYRHRHHIYRIESALRVPSPKRCQKSPYPRVSKDEKTISADSTQFSIKTRVRL